MNKYEFKGEGVLYAPAAPMPQSFRIVMGGSHLEFTNDGKVTFHGDADEAADLFLNTFIRTYNASYQKMLEDNRRLVAENAHITGCLSAAMTEGLHDVVYASCNDRLIDLYERRLQFAVQPTPATESVVNDIRAQAVESFAAGLGKMYQELPPNSRPARGALKAVIFRAVAFAKQLREG